MAAGAEYYIETLSQAHDLSRFDCGNDALNTWLTRFAWTNVRDDSARVYVLHRHDRVVRGYYALTAGSIHREDAPQKISQGLAGHAIGVAVMGRLAVDSSHQDKGLGTTLLQDALMRIEQAGDMIGIRALLVQAINDTARDFYLRFGFSPSPIDELQLMLLMKDLRAFLRTR
jgi:GNAT superfamily N-acetyltransferase